MSLKDQFTTALIESIDEAFSMILALSPKLKDKESCAVSKEGLVCSVDFRGSLDGAVALCLSREAACRLASKMLEITVTEISHDVNYAISEFLTTVVSGANIRLAVIPHVFELHPAVILQNKDFDIPISDDISLVKMGFSCEEFDFGVIGYYRVNAEEKAKIQSGISEREIRTTIENGVRPGAEQEFHDKKKEEKLENKSGEKDEQPLEQKQDHALTQDKPEESESTPQEPAGASLADVHQEEVPQPEPIEPENEIPQSLPSQEEHGAQEIPEEKPPEPSEEEAQQKAQEEADEVKEEAPKDEKEALLQKELMPEESGQAQAEKEEAADRQEETSQKEEASEPEVSEPSVMAERPEETLQEEPKSEQDADSSVNSILKAILKEEDQQAKGGKDPVSGGAEEEINSVSDIPPELPEIQPMPSEELQENSSDSSPQRTVSKEKIIQILEELAQKPQEKLSVDEIKAALNPLFSQWPSEHLDAGEPPENIEAFNTEAVQRLNDLIKKYRKTPKN